MAPIVDGLIPKYEGTVAIVKYNLDESGEGVALAKKHEVQFVPTFVFVNGDGTVSDTIIGEATEDALRGALDKLQ